MNTRSLKREIARLYQEAMKLEGDLFRNQLAWGEWHFKSKKGDVDPPEWLVDEDESLIKPFRYLAETLYLSTVLLLDKAGLSNYLVEFKKKFGEDFDSKAAASGFELDHYWSGEHYNIFLADLRQYFVPLDILGDDSRYRKLAGVQYLETILRNTSVILTTLGKVAKTETDVYKSVRHVLTSIFPSSKHPTSKFIQTAQEYKPDILIPELSAAVEYKYAADEAKLKATIAQISDDVKGYRGDDDYRLFYAVFYITSDFWGQEKFKKVWDEKQFPDNWIGIYVVGK